MSPPTPSPIRAGSIRPFVGTGDFALSLSFYRAIGFEEKWIGDRMRYLELPGGVGFYLQDYFVKEWVDNSMLFLEVDDLDRTYAHLMRIVNTEIYGRAKVSQIMANDWGRECFLHDPAGVLWHVGTFNS